MSAAGGVWPQLEHSKYNLEIMRDKTNQVKSRQGASAMPVELQRGENQKSRNVLI